MSWRASVSLCMYHSRGMCVFLFCFVCVWFVCVWSLVFVVWVIFLYVDMVFGFYGYSFLCLVGCLSMIILTPAVLSVLNACVCIFVFAPVQCNWACFTWKGALEIRSLLLHTDTHSLSFSLSLSLTHTHTHARTHMHTEQKENLKPINFCKAVLFIGYTKRVEYNVKVNTPPKWYK